MSPYTSNEEDDPHVSDDPQDSDEIDDPGFQNNDSKSEWFRAETNDQRWSVNQLMTG